MPATSPSPGEPAGHELISDDAAEDEEAKDDFLPCVFDHEKNALTDFSDHEATEKNTGDGAFAAAHAASPQHRSGDGPEFEKAAERGTESGLRFDEEQDSGEARQKRTEHKREDAHTGGID